MLFLSFYTLAICSLTYNVYVDKLTLLIADDTRIRDPDTFPWIAPGHISPVVSPGTTSRPFYVVYDIPSSTTTIRRSTI